MSYVTLDQIKQKLQGKVLLENWSQPDTPTNVWDNQTAGVVLTDAELQMYIDESEAEVMLDLSQLYFTPIQEKDGNTDLDTFKSPVAAQLLKNIFTYRACIYALMNIYGQTNSVDDDRYSYIEKLEALYDINLEKALKRWEGGGGFVYPALEGVKLSQMYATRQHRQFPRTVKGNPYITDPAETIARGIKSVNKPNKYWFRWFGSQDVQATGENPDEPLE